MVLGLLFVPNQCEGPGDGAERCLRQEKRGEGREKQGACEALQASRATMFFSVSRGFKSRHSDQKSVIARRAVADFL